MTFDEYWATTGPWPDNILLTSAFREVAQKAWAAGRDSVGIDPGVLRAMDNLTDALERATVEEGRPLEVEEVSQPVVVATFDRTRIQTESNRNAPRAICGAYVEHGLGPNGKGCPQTPGHEGNHGDVLARPLISCVPAQLRPDIPEPPEGWTEHRARGCQTIHLDARCPEGYVPKEHCAIRLATGHCPTHGDRE